jgi:hypothetical protein
VTLLEQVAVKAANLIVDPGRCPAGLRCATAGDNRIEVTVDANLEHVLSNGPRQPLADVDGV